MQLVIDIEGNRLENPDKIWCIICKDITSGKVYTFRNLTENQNEKKRFLALLKKCERLIGHYILGYDLPVIASLLEVNLYDYLDICVDTLIVSKLYDYSRDGHSIQDYGYDFGLHKIDFLDFSKWSIELERYCLRDVEIAEKIYLKYLSYIEEYIDVIKIKQKFQLVCNDLNINGFSFNSNKAKELLSTIEETLEQLDKDILEAFPPSEKLIREFTPKATKFNTISLSSIPKALRHKVHEYEVGNTYRHTKLEPFNPSSPKQIVEVLTAAGWKPVDKTKTHIDVEREINILNRTNPLDPTLVNCYTKLKSLRRYGWKINEKNLSTLPPDAPSSARTLARRILVESRRRTLVEWLSLVKDDGRIHGRFYGIGAWTHRMAHQNPNTANIPREFDEQGNVKLLGKEMRELWEVPKDRLLVGVDAESIQLRIFAHYINDPEFTYALVKGKKEDKSDPHSLNQRVLGSVCKSRQAAKRFIYALLLGAGIGKLAEILGVSQDEARIALDRLLARYQGFAYLKENVIPTDAKRGWFVGLDGLPIRIPSNTEGGRRHLCMSGYLQNGEKVIMERACLLWHDQLRAEKIDFKFVDFVHDEWQTEVPNNMEIALRVAEIQAESLRIVGEELKLNCPMAGSFWNEDTKTYTIGTNWYQTH